MKLKLKRPGIPTLMIGTVLLFLLGASTILFLLWVAVFCLFSNLQEPPNTGNYR